MLGEHLFEIMYVIIFSAKGTAPVRLSSLGSPSTSRAVEIEASADGSSSTACSAHHRLPVFVNFNNDSPDRHASHKRDISPCISGAPSSVLRCSSHSSGHHSVPRIQCSQTVSSDHRTKRANQITWILGEGCCNYRSSNVPPAAICADHEQSFKVSPVGNYLGETSFDLFGPPMIDRFCPFHQIPSLWLVPHPLCDFILLFMFSLCYLGYFNSVLV